MMRKYQVRFGGGTLEKGLRATSPMSYPAVEDTQARRSERRAGEAGSSEFRN